MNLLISMPRRRTVNANSSRSLFGWRRTREFRRALFERSKKGLCEPPPFEGEVLMNTTIVEQAKDSRTSGNESLGGGTNDLSRADGWTDSWLSREPLSNSEERDG